MLSLRRPVAARFARSHRPGAVHAHRYGGCSGSDDIASGFLMGGWGVIQLACGSGCGCVEPV